METLPSLSIFFPAYNDAKILPYLIARTYRILPRITSDYEVIIVNDGSTDDTALIVHELTLRYPHLRVITHESNKGYGGALISGFAASTKDWIFYTDGDCQYDPHDIKKLIRKRNPSTTVVNGYKLNRGDGIVRLVTGAVYNFIVHRMYPLPIRDVDCDFRLIKRSLLQGLSLQSNSGSICVELVIKLQQKGAKFQEVGVRHYPRPTGTSHFLRPASLLKTARDTVRFFMNRQTL